MSGISALGIAALGFLLVAFLGVRLGSARKSAEVAESLLQSLRRLQTLPRRLRDPDERRRLRRKFSR